MKYLYLVRHAKSSWDYPELSDFERPLNKRGKRNAPEMGMRLAKRNLTFDAVVSSPANRALTTADTIAGQLGFAKKQIIQDESVYHGSRSELISIIHQFSDHWDTVMLVGHNPGFTDLANYLKAPDHHINNVPTCGVVAIEFTTNHWNDIGMHSGKLLFFDYPKKTPQ
jgi:phosphohistidine phosphatase